MKIQISTIQFPGIQMQTREGHKLRGYFGTLFREHSPLLHNHFETGEFRYDYPLVQYKVIDAVPTLLALQEGAELLSKLFLKIREIRIDEKIYPVTGKNISHAWVEAGYTDHLNEYRFKTLWMALNQQNHLKFTGLQNQEEKKRILERILTGNMLSFFKGMGIFLQPEQLLMAKCRLEERITRFKGKDMVAFSGSFVANVDLPTGIGLGKAVSRGFGTITKI